MYYCTTYYYFANPIVQNSAAEGFIILCILSERYVLKHIEEKAFKDNNVSALLFQITKLKIDSNPFAKGFRDSSRLTEFER